MPKREDDFWASRKEKLNYCIKHKRYYKADYGCQLCIFERLGTKRATHDRPRLQKCPECKRDSLFWNEKTELYECLNPKCKRRFTLNELRTKIHTPYLKPQPSKTHFIKILRPKLSIMIVKKTISSFWKYLKRVFILLAIVIMTSIVVVAVCLFVSGEIRLSSAILISVVGISILIWGLTTLSKRRIGFTRMFMFLLISGLFIIPSSVYLGIKSPADIRDSVLAALSMEKEQFRSTIDMIVQRTELKVVDTSSTITDTDEETEKEIASEEGGVSDSAITTEHTKHVYINGAIIVGADGHYITLENNPNATNPSWEELKAFLLIDDTDSKTYDFDTFVCADFAELLHNNAEAAGIRSAFVSIQLGPCSYYPTIGGHTLNAFETTDEGLVYIDCTGCPSTCPNADKVVKVQVGKDFVPESIFPTPGWSPIWENMGMVEEIEILQW